MDNGFCGGFEMMSLLSTILNKIRCIMLDKPAKFEIFIGKYFKNSGEFDVIRAPRTIIPGLKSTEDNLPDFKFADKRSGKEFWVECKWRPRWYYKDDSKALFFKPGLIKLYKKIQRESDKKIFLALGIGVYKNSQDTLNPRELYFFPLNMFADLNYIRQSYLLRNDRMHKFRFKKPKFFPQTNDLR